MHVIIVLFVQCRLSLILKLSGAFSISVQCHRQSLSITIIDHQFQFNSTRLLGAHSLSIRCYLQKYTSKDGLGTTLDKYYDRIDRPIGAWKCFRFRIGHKELCRIFTDQDDDIDWVHMCIKRVRLSNCLVAFYCKHASPHKSNLKKLLSRDTSGASKLYKCGFSVLS